MPYPGEVLDGLRHRIERGAGGEVRGATVRRVLGYLHPHRVAVAAALACLLTGSLLALAPYVVVEQLINDLTHPNGSFTRILALACIGLGLVVLSGLVGVLRSWIVLRITTETVARVRRELMQRLLGQSIGYFTGERGGELMSRLLNDVNVVEAAVGESALSVVGSTITVVICVIVMAAVQWQLALVTIATLPLLVVTLRRARRPVYRTRRDLQERLAAFTVHAQEVLSLSGIMLVKTFGREADERQRSLELADALRRSDMRAGMTARWVGFAFQFAQALAPLALLLAGAWLIEHHDATLGSVIAFVTVLAARFGAALAATGTGLVSAIGTLPAWDRVFSVLDTNPISATCRTPRCTQHPGRRQLRRRLLHVSAPGSAGDSTRSSLTSRPDSWSRWSDPAARARRP